MPSFDTDDKRWAAIQTRNALADSEFLYGVVTTGVYCYPSCPSRLSLRANTRFFLTRKVAVEQGFRPCRRCRSDEPPLLERQQQLVEEACRIIEDSACAVRIASLADQLQISRFHLQKLFKQFLGLSPKHYAEAVRARQLGAALSRDTSVTHAVYKAGYNNASTYYVSGAKRLGMPARTYQKGGSGLLIRYAFGKTRFGKIVVAATDKGVCSVLFGDSQRALKTDLLERFSQATVVKDSEALAATLQAVIAHIEDPGQSCSLPMDIQGTVFQEKVWRALRDIKPGETASYSQIAEAIGKPTAARAVALACAANPVAVLVPCHRVVRAGGQVSGYRWGVERKQELLDNERVDD